MHNPWAGRRQVCERLDGQEGRQGEEGGQVQGGKVTQTEAALPLPLQDQRPGLLRVQDPAPRARPRQAQADRRRRRRHVLPQLTARVVGHVGLFVRRVRRLVVVGPAVVGRLGGRRPADPVQQALSGGVARPRDGHAGWRGGGEAVHLLNYTDDHPMA